MKSITDIWTPIIFLIFAAAARYSSFVEAKITYPLEVALVVDESGSIKPDDYELMWKVIKQFPDRFEMGDKHTRLAVVRFGWTTVFSLNLTTNEMDLKNLNVTKVGGITFTDFAFDEMREEVFVAGHVRPGVRKIIILIMDGLAEDEDEFEEAAKRARDDNFKIYVAYVGVINPTIRAHLNRVTGDSSRVFPLADYSTLLKTFEKIGNGLEEQSTPRPTTVQPPTTKPTTTKPTTTQSTTTKPSTTQPSTEQPSTTKPSTEQPSTTQPSTVHPSTEQSSTVQPLATQGSTASPGFGGVELAMVIIGVIILLIIIALVIWCVLVKRKTSPKRKEPPKLKTPIPTKSIAAKSMTKKSMPMKSLAKTPLTPKAPMAPTGRSMALNADARAGADRSVGVSLRDVGPSTAKSSRKMKKSMPATKSMAAAKSNVPSKSMIPMKGTMKKGK